MGEHIRLESVGYNPLTVEKDGSRTIDPLVAKRIGKGGYATTYRVQTQPGMPVGGILKVFGLYPETYRVGERLRRKAEWSALYDEYDMLCALDGLDGHVPQAYASSFFVEDDGEGGLRYRPAFLMEEIGNPAEQLHEVLNEHREPFEANQVATFGLRMLDVLDLLAKQGKGIAHADLSPWNVYVRRSPDGKIFEWVYLIDFGQAKYAARGVTPSFVSGVHPRMGTVEYCAPELIPRFSLYEDDTAACREHNELYALRNDPTVDLWSLGALMYLLALRRAPSYSVEYATRGCASGLVSGFWRGNTLLKEDEAFRILVEEKRAGLGLPSYMSKDGELLLSQAIALCTAWDPRDRDRLHIRRLLKRAAEGADDERFMPMTHVPELTPALAGEGGHEQDARIEPGAVFAGVYKLTAPDGAPFSDAGADLLVFGDSEQAVDIREYRYRGVMYAADRVGPRYDMTDNGWDVIISNKWCNSPWKSVRIVDFLTEIRPTTMQAWFSECAELAELLHIDRMDTSSVRDMGYMFHGCSSLAELDVSGFQTSRVKSFRAMFSDCSALASLDVSGFDTSSATDMNEMFDGCSLLSALDVSGFDTSSVTDMGDMFFGCSSLTELDLSGFDTLSVTDMSYMFFDCPSLVALDVSGFDTSSVTDMCWMFYGCSSLASLDVSGFDTSSATDMSAMFYGCSSLAALNVSGFNTSKVASFRGMFSGCSSLAELDVSGFDTSSVTDMSEMFHYCSKLSSLDVSGFQTSRVKSFHSMFSDCSSLTALDVSGFDTSSANDMSSMFFNCRKLVSLDVSGFDASNATDLSFMFSECASLVDLKGWPFPIREDADIEFMFDD